MMRRALVCLTALCLAHIGFAAQCLGAQLRVETHLEPSGNPVVGETVQLQVDVLTDTWFAAPPQMPTLELVSATVSPPSGEARHLTVTRDGTPLFGLQYTYRITPSAAGEVQLPPLTIIATPGQADAPISVLSEPLHFSVEQPAGVAVGDSVVVSSGLELTQDIHPSRDNPGIGDSVRRLITQTADGAQMMLIPPIVFADIDGLKLYAESPQVKALDDGRGNVSGGVRVDSVRYVITREGDFQLPPVRVQWWDSGARQLKTAELPGASFHASATPLKTPFSIKEDLQRLGQHGRISLSRYGLAVALWLVGLGVVLYIAWPRCRQAWLALNRRRAGRHQQWLDSPGHALKQIPEQLRSSPPRLDALYLWAHRQFGATGLKMLATPLRREVLDGIYGLAPQPAAAVNTLKSQIPSLYRAVTNKKQAPRHGLRPLNPRCPDLLQQEIKR